MLRLVAIVALVTSSLDAASLIVEPAAIKLVGHDAIERLIVTGPERDLTHSAQYQSSKPTVVHVSPDGIVTPKGDGSATITIAAAGNITTVAVTVERFASEELVSFRNQVLPILTKRGCNSGGCHGKQYGQNGFKLSLLGFDAKLDYAAIVEEGRGRRLFPAAPERSLLLVKAAGFVPHGGGRKLTPDSLEYLTLLRWIRQGTPRGSEADRRVTRIEASPKSAIVERNGSQQMRVRAFYSDGTAKDVTHEAQYKSNETDIATVDEAGRVRTDKTTGDTGIMARYMGHVDVCRVTIPQSAMQVAWPKLPAGNFIDRFTREKWQQLNLVPSPLSDDSTFLRRVFLDTIGTLPTPAETEAFLADSSADKRAKVIDRLLERDEYADYWAVKWGDLLRNQRKGQREHQRGTYAFHAWIRDSLSRNVPYDRFVRNIIAAQGTVDQHPPVIWYRTVRNLTHQTNDTAQLFLGLRINCAQCHHHPYEKWSQDDYYSLQAFFARMGKKSGDIAQEPAIYVKPDGDVRNPTTGQKMAMRGLDGPEVKVSEDEDPRHKLVDWMVEPTNPFFAKALVNRMWGHLLGRGIVDPVDDMRITNPPSNPALLDALAKDFIDHKYDLKRVLRVILNSTTYQLSGEPIPENVQDKQNFARAYPRRLSAEVLLDAINAVTGTMEDFPGLPKGSRAIQLPDEAISSYFLDVFGRPTRETPCECERPREANLAQSLQLLNSPAMQQKVADSKGRLAKLLKEKKSPAEIVDAIYLTAFCRKPTPSERSKIDEYLTAATSKPMALEDIVWAVLNTKEFLFNH